MTEIPHGPGENPPPRPVTPNTFSSIQLDPLKDASLPFDQFVESLLVKLKHVKEQRSRFFDDLRRQHTKWANGARGYLAGLGAIAFLLTSFAAAIRLGPTASFAPRLTDADKGIMLAVLALYAIMGAITFYEKGTDKSTTYLRQVATIVAIRDLWTKLQFQLFKETIALKDAPDPKAAEPAARERIRALAEAFCADLDKAASTELTEFRTELITSLSELDAIAKKGLEDTTKQLQDAATAALKAAAEAKTAAEKAAADAKIAAKAAEDAAKPGFLNVTVTGDFDGELEIAVEGAAAVRTTGKTVAIDRVPPGPKKVSAKAKKGAKLLEVSVAVDIKPGIQDLRLTLA
jgi:hypothetical protein